MNWNEGYTAKYYLTIVDPLTFQDVETYSLISGTIKREGADLMHSADLVSPDYSETSEKIVRVWLDAAQDGGSSHTPLFTGYTATPEINITYQRQRKSLQCYSVLKPAQDILLDRGWYAPVDIDGAVLVKQLLKVTNSPVEISEKTDRKRKLTNAIIAESGETNLSMAWKILDAMNWRLRIDGYGRIFVEPYSKEETAIFDTISNDIIEPSITIQYDWYDCPNVLRVVVGDDVFISKDMSDKEMSIPSRGREIWTEETSPALNDRETGQDYADRRLKELQRVSKLLSYDRRFDPDIYPTDIVYISLPRFEIEGQYFISSQTIELGFHAKTSEEVYKL